MMTDGNNFSDKLMNVKGNCPNCGTTLTFMESAQLAKDNNISEDAVMCHRCQKVFTVNITQHEMNFVKDITSINNEDKDTKLEYAEIFKEAIEEENLEKAQSILDKWLVDSPDDANMFYATIILDSASKVKAIDTNLEDWYIVKANKSIEIQKDLNNSKSNESGNNNVKTEIPSQNEINRPNHQQSLEQIQQTDIQQQVMNNNYNQSAPKNRSIFEILFYKQDKKTQEIRISKTKTISILIFLFMFVFLLISMIIVPRTDTDPAFIFGYIFASIIIALIVTVPVFLIGHLISYLLERE